MHPARVGIFFSLLVHAAVGVWFWCDLVSPPPRTSEITVDFVEVYAPARSPLAGDRPLRTRTRAPLEPLKVKSDSAALKTRPLESNEQHDHTHAHAHVDHPQTKGHDHSEDSGRPLQHYLEHVAHVIDQRKVYPQAALRRRQQGRVLVNIHVQRDGQITGVQLLKPSAHPILDEATLALVRGLERLPPVPPEIAEGELYLRVPIVYSVER